jgi:hypothetical protein
MSDANGTGAIVTVIPVAEGPIQKALVGTTGSFLTADSRLVHFGLGQLHDKIHEVVVDFPATKRQVVLNDVKPNEVLEILEPEGDAAK